MGTVSDRYCIQRSFNDKYTELSYSYILECDSNNNGCAGGYADLALDSGTKENCKKR